MTTASAAPSGDAAASATASAAQPVSVATAQSNGVGEPTAASAAAAAAPAAPGTIALPDGMGDWLKSKGVTDPSAISSNEALFKLANSYRETEKWALGGDKIVIPKGLEGDAHTEAMNQIYDKLGRPPTADKYQFDIPQGGDSTLALSAADVFHKAGLNQEQATALNAWWNGEAVKVATAQAEADATAVREDSVKLDAEWGADKKHNTELATRGWNAIAKELGLEGEAAGEMQDAIAEKLGVLKTMKLFKLMGDKIGTTGDAFEGATAGGKGGQFTMTPQAAQARIETLKQDTAFQGRRNKGDAQAVNEWNELLKTAAAGQVFTG